IRSVYSLLSSMCTIEGIISYAKKYGYDHLGLVDRNVLAGAMSFKKACEKADIVPIYGLEFDVEAESRIYTCILYAKDDEGFKNLMALSSYICTKGVSSISVDLVKNYTDHNVLCLLSDNMPLTYVIDKKEDPEEMLMKQKIWFGDYIVALIDHDIASNAYRDQLLKPVLKSHGIKTIALSRTFYLQRDDYEVFNVLKCIRDKRIIDDHDFVEETGRHFMTKEEYDLLYDREDLINADLFASKLHVSMSYMTSLPVYDNRKGIPSKDYLVLLCREGLKRRLKNSVPQVYIRRLEYELKVILDMHFEDYFLIVYDFILYAKKQGIMVGPGRGSAAGSLVSYCLGITDIDPIRYGLIFERFLNPERISMPDIDTDFPDDRRDEVIAYVKDRYGIEHVGHIITYGTLKAKQVLRDVGRVLNYPNREIDALCKLIPNALDMDLSKAYDEVPLFAQKIESEERFRRLYRISRKLEFFPRHESTLAAGIVMSRKPLDEVVPITRIESDIYSTQYTMEYLEELGLIKMDFLGLRNLGIIAEIVDDIKKDQDFDIRSIPLNDKKTFDLIDSVNVAGIFQLESSGMRNLIRKMRPRTFEEIGMTIALYRPGPMKNIPLFLDYRAHPEKVDYIHPNLQPILKETYGIIVYQEQIINIARVMAGFSYGKADILRKAMSKKKLSELEKLHSDFIEGCVKNGYDGKLSEQVYALILEFANYGFNKSHSIAYALVAYQLAYLKANHPLYFYKALLNGVMGSQSKTYDYISECMNIGQKVKGISLNGSMKSYKIEKDSIVMPFGICKDVGSISADKIIEERMSGGPFTDYVQAVKRLVLKGVERNVIENPIYAGAFDEFRHSRHTMIASLNNVIMYANAHKGEISLMNDFDDAPIIEELSDDHMVLAENEKNVLGFYFSFNPIIAVKKKYNIECDNLYNLSVSTGPVKGFGLIKRVKSLKTKRGEMMAFVDLVDDKGAISLAVMPRVYAMHSSDLVKGRYVKFEGKIEKEASCLVRNMEVL
ncbi:MAG: DNA polymerase III subunit alpha, partial [Erysipelotrichaceae bacterium]|nr:DNA polymerase III subunit alpha [Erysipelotrichaceae bacterium]